MSPGRALSRHGKRQSPPTEINSPKYNEMNENMKVNFDDVGDVRVYASITIRTVSIVQVDIYILMVDLPHVYYQIAMLWTISAILRGFFFVLALVGLCGL